MVPPFNVCDLIFPRLAPSCCDIIAIYCLSASQLFTCLSMEKSGFKISEIWEIVTNKRIPTYNNRNFNENLTRNYSQCQFRLLLFFRVSTLTCSNFSLINYVYQLPVDLRMTSQYEGTERGKIKSSKLRDGTILVIWTFSPFQPVKMYLIIDFLLYDHLIYDHCNNSLTLV